RGGVDGTEVSRPDALLWLEMRIRHALGPTLARLARSRVDAVVLSCGSARDLARLAGELGLDAPLTGGASKLTADATRHLQAWLAADTTAARTLPVSGGDPGRVDT